jgi:hypothetical protein
MKNKHTLLFCVTVFSSLSCDLITTKSDKIVGNIYVVNPKTQPDSGYTLIYMNRTGNNENILNEYVSFIKGNDTLLLVGCLNSENENIYYRVKHQNGRKPISFINLSFKQFDSMLSTVTGKYVFAN